MKLVNQLLDVLKEVKGWGISMDDVSQILEYTDVVKKVDAAIEAGNDYQKERAFNASCRA